jgi:hypothetical protein
MPGAPIFAVESINETAEVYGANVEKIRGEKFQKLYKEIMMLDDAIIDVGASNVVAFQEGMLRYHNSQEEFSAFIVPTTSGTKEQKETIAMIETLSALGIEPSRIKVVCNRVLEDVEDEFGVLFAYARKSGTSELSPEAAIWESELMDLLQIRRMSLSEILADEKDYRALARELDPITDSVQRELYKDLHVMKALAKNVCLNFDTCFWTMFPEAKHHG